MPPHLQQNRIFLKWCFWCSVKHVLCLEGGKNPLSLAWRVVGLFVFLFTETTSKCLFAFSPGFAGIQTFQVFFHSFGVRAVSGAVPLGFCKPRCTAHSSRVSVAKTLSVTYSRQPNCFSWVLLTYCPFPSADSLALHCCCFTLLPSYSLIDRSQ